MAKKPAMATKRGKSPKANQEKARRAKIAATIAKLDQIKPVNAKVAQTIALFKSWLADESGYDEETLPKLMKALDRERDRVGARRLFDV